MLEMPIRYSSQESSRLLDISLEFGTEFRAGNIYLVITGKNGI